MSDDLLPSGGPYKIRREGDTYRMKIPLPCGPDGFLARACPSESCSSGYFRIKLGTGLKESNHAFCPYCRRQGGQCEFHTKEQVAHATSVLEHEVYKGISDRLDKAFGLGPSGRRTLDGGLLSIEISREMRSLPQVRYPLEELLRRGLTCSHCTLEHAVYGLATWCPDCGADIFSTHVAAELNLVRRMVGDVESRRERLGVRAAARDIENALEDIVSVLEAGLKSMTRRKLLETMQAEEVERRMAAVGTGFQGIPKALRTLARELGANLTRDLAPDETARISATLEKRHPIAHNLGIVDRQYLERAQAGELAGHEVHVTTEEVLDAMSLVELAIQSAHTQLFARPAPGPFDSGG